MKLKKFASAASASFLNSLYHGAGTVVHLLLITTNQKHYNCYFDDIFLIRSLLDGNARDAKTGIDNDRQLPQRMKGDESSVTRIGEISPLWQNFQKSLAIFEA